MYNILYNVDSDIKRLVTTNHVDLGTKEINGHKHMTMSFVTDGITHTLIDVKDVIICHNKNMVKGDIRIDDGIHNLYDGSINILVNQPCNQSKTDNFNSKYMRVNSWEDIEKVLNQIFHTKNYIRL